MRLSIILVSVVLTAALSLPVRADQSSFAWGLAEIPLHLAGVGERVLPVRTSCTSGRIAVDLHVHTAYSPGCAANVEELLLTAVRRGFSAIAVCDHDTSAGGWFAQQECQRLRACGKIPGDFIVIRGQEVSTVEGHINALFIRETIPPLLTATEAIRRIHAQGGLAVAVHPGSMLGIGFRRAGQLPLDAVEARQQVEGYVTVLGSDAHSATLLGLAGYTILGLEGPLSENAVYQSIRAGRAQPVPGVLPLPGLGGPHAVSAGEIISRFELGLTLISRADAVNIRWPSGPFPTTALGGYGFASDGCHWLDTESAQPFSLGRFLVPTLEFRYGPVYGWVNPLGEWRVGVYESF